MAHEARNISSNETNHFIEWLYEEHDIEFRKYGTEEKTVEEVQALWDEYVNG